MINVTVLPPIVGTEPFCNIGRLAVNGEVVLTNAQAADFYGAKVINIQQNFNNNKTHFIEGKHYFKLEGEDLKKFKTILQNENLSDDYLENFEVVGLRTRHVYLWTKLGILRHCKMLNTDKAWEVFELMENTFFNVLENSTESNYKNDFFPPKLSARWADIKGAEVLVTAAKLTSSNKFREHLVKQAHSMITGKEFIEEEKSDNYDVKI